MAAQAKGGERPRKLVYLGGKVEGGHHADAYFDGVPARDLDEADIARLSDERLARITTPHPTLGPLYAASKTEANSAEAPPPPAVVPPGEAVPATAVEGEFGDEGNLRPDGGR